MRKKIHNTDDSAIETLLKMLVKYMVKEENLKECQKVDHSMHYTYTKEGVTLTVNSVGNVERLAHKKVEYNPSNPKQYKKGSLQDIRDLTVHLHKHEMVRMGYM